jgi:predicted nucleic acid-binding protein
MIELLVDTNVLIHLLHSTGNAEAGLTRQLLDWDRAGHIRIVVAAASGDEQGRSPQQLESELETLGLSPDRIVDIAERSEAIVNEISAILGHRKAGDWLDALMVYTALDRLQQGHETWLVTGDRNILRHAEILQEFRVPPVVSLRGTVSKLKVDFPLTRLRSIGING